MTSTGKITGKEWWVTFLNIRIIIKEVSSPFLLSSSCPVITPSDGVLMSGLIAG